MNQDSDLEVAVGIPVNDKDNYPLLQPMKDTVATYNKHVKDERLSEANGADEIRSRTMSTGSV
jgi:hypothetical protein